jgi:hypothetical protein
MNNDLFAPIKRNNSNVLLCIEKYQNTEKLIIFSNRKKAFRYLLDNNTANEMVYCRKTGLSFSKPLQHYSMFYECIRSGCFSFYRACNGKPYSIFTIHILKIQ